MKDEPNVLGHYKNYGQTEGRFPNFYQKAITLNPNLRENLQEITIDPKLSALLDLNDSDATELVCEIIALGDPIDHTVTDFSSVHYANTYRDIQLAKIVPFEHYIVYGLNEGRTNLKGLRAGVRLGKTPFDPEKQTCLICVHELSKTGAPIVGLDMLKQAREEYNVIVLALRGGALLSQFLENSTAVYVNEKPLQAMEYIQIDGFNDIEFSILNSVESFLFIPLMVAQEVPFAIYIHEYTEYSLPAYKPNHAALFSDLLVFSSQPLHQSWQPTLTDLGVDQSRDVALLPQSPLTVSNVTKQEYLKARARISMLIGKDCTNKRIVYGAGEAQWRKGTDLFVMTAQIAATQSSDTIFIWMGDGRNREDIHFGVWLEKHLTEAGANLPDSNLFFAPSGEFYLDLCKAADSMFMPSRLDPLPNVVFDAAKYGCNITLFRGGTGFDDPLYAENEQLNFVEYGNLSKAVQQLLEAPQKATTTRLSRWLKTKAHDAVETQIQSTPATAPTSLDQPIKLSGPPFQTISEALKKVVEARSPILNTDGGEYDVPVLFSSAPANTAYRKKERAKMWQLNRDYVWQSRTTAQERLHKSDNWVHKSLGIEQHNLLSTDTSPPEFCIHVHAHYSDDLSEDISNHAAYKAAKRVVVTTDTPQKADQIRSIMTAEGIHPEILVTKNQGRDILPFMKLFYPGGAAENDEIWCHIHQKKSITSTDGGDLWRQFLLSNLLGTRDQLSNAVQKIAQTDTGMVTAFDPYMLGWNASLPLLRQVTSDLKNPMPEHPFLFPIGNMFWVRQPVVRRMNQLIGLNYPWPNEPIENDGTIFHLIERLWPTASALLHLNSVFLDKPDEKRR
ncbi:MAG: rhamnan synthesis F family protein [Pseudoruegeria sp.]